MKQRITAYGMIIKNEGDRYVKYFDSFPQMMNVASKVVAFDDLTGDVIEDIWVDSPGHTETIRYVGWRPGMEMQFVNQDNVVVWDEYYPEWDH